MSPTLSIAPSAARRLIECETVGGMMAAEAVLVSLTSDRAWQAWFDMFRGPEQFAALCYPYPDWTQEARDAFGIVFRHGMTRAGIRLVEGLVILPGRPHPRRRRRSPRG
jgi:hypothetical protein